MKKLIFPILLLASVTLWSCGDDSDSVPSEPEVDKEYSKIGKDAEPYAQRLEVPVVKDKSMFMVHATNFNGVTFTEEWDKSQRTQRWAAYTMNATNSKANWNRNNWNGYKWNGVVWSGDPFQENPVLPKVYRTTAEDHYANGYDRGHIVNSQDRLVSAFANGQTYYLSNIQPQNHDFNSGVWLNMENMIHNRCNNNSFRTTLYVVKGGSTQKTAKVPNPFIADSRCKIPVPRYFWMAVLCEKDKRYKAMAMWVEHKPSSDNNLRTYAISINELEERTGIDLYPNLPDDIEESIESTLTLSDWPW